MYVNKTFYIIAEIVIGYYVDIKNQGRTNEEAEKAFAPGHTI